MAPPAPGGYTVVLNVDGAEAATSEANRLGQKSEMPDKLNPLELEREFPMLLYMAIMETKDVTCYRACWYG